MSFDIKQCVNSLETGWHSILSKLSDPYVEDINAFVNKEIKEFEGVADVLPPTNLILNAFSKCDLAEIKAVIIGQDCYPTKGDAMGLCFSVPNGVRCPPSLRNIFKELDNEYSVLRTSTDLTDWAEQGVLMLNTALTVRQGCPGSHIKAWKCFTRDVVKYVSENTQHVCWMLWGEHAISFIPCINTSIHHVLIHSHPSPLSRKSFVGCGHFKECNKFLESVNKKPIKWV